MPITSHAARMQAAMQIHREILAGTYPNATGLARLLDVSAKTARSYVALLSDLFGVNPLYDEIRHGYYYDRDGPARTSLVPHLREEEVAAVFLIEQAARDLAGSPIQKVLESVLSKLSLMLPSGCGVSLEDISSALSLRTEGAATVAERDRETLTALYSALIDRRRVRMTYGSAGAGKAGVTQRSIDPLHLTRCEGQWYLVAYCNLRKEIRTFVPARMKDVRVLKETFQRPANFDPREHFRSAFGIAAGKDVRDVAIRFDPRVAVLIRERQWHPTQRISEIPQEQGGGVRMTLTCSQGLELQAWILGWGEQARVEQPEELAVLISRRHAAAAERYRDSSNGTILAKRHTNA